MLKRRQTLSFSRRQKYWKFMILVVPLLAIWAIFAIYPNLSIYELMFYKYSGFGSEKIFVGLQNIKIVLLKGEWVTFLKNTAVYIFYLLIIQTILSLFLSLALAKNTRHNRFFRALFFITMVFSSVMVGLTWSFIYDANLGILNNILSWLGFKSMAGYNWMASDNSALLCIVIVHIWANIGYPITILTAGINTIPVEVNEAAMIDGASKCRTFWHITLPLLSPTLLNMTMLTVTTGAMAFDYVLLLGSSMTTTGFDTWSVQIYKSIIQSSPQYGTIAVHSAMLGILMIVMTVIQFVIQRNVAKRVQ